jgi:hypothetical protein
LDTGVVYGNHLSCLIVEENRRSIHTVRALKQYCVPTIPN